MSQSRLSEVLDRFEAELITDWSGSQSAQGIRRGGAETDLQKGVYRSFLSALREALRTSPDGVDLGRPEWSRVREILNEFSSDRAQSGYTASETANFVFSLKQPLFERLRRVHGQDAAGLAEDVWQSTVLLDRLGLYTGEIYQKSRESVIQRQQQEMLELSTPVVQLWNSVLALPLIGTLDSARTQIVMQNLLQAIVEKEAAIAIIDITGVPTVDTLVAQHLLKTVAAARLMGADCIISGIRPQIAQTIIHLGVELSDVTTKATLADAFQLALKRTGMSIIRTQKL